MQKLSNGRKLPARKLQEGVQGMQNWTRMMFNLVGYRKKNRNTMWFSVIGIAISAVAALLGFTRGKGFLNFPGQNQAGQNHTETNRTQQNFSEPNLVKNFASSRDINVMDNAALAEFSEELLSSALKNERK